MESVLITDVGTRSTSRPQEYANYLEARAQVLSGMSVAEFECAYEASEVDEADPAVSELVALLRIGQNDRLKQW